MRGLFSATLDVLAIRDEPHGIGQLSERRVQRPHNCPGRMLEFLERIHETRIRVSYQGNYPAAVTDFDKAVRSDPDNAQAFYGDGTAHLCLGQFDRAVVYYNSAVRLDPEWFDYPNRGVAYEEKGDYPRALADFDQSIKLKPEDPVFYIEREHLYSRMGKPLLAEKDLNIALGLVDGLSDPGYLNSYAWILATSPSKEERYGPIAVRFATKACELTDWHDSVTLDTLAAAYAENGQFKEAVEWQKKALEVAKDPSESLRTQQLKERLALYEKHQPYREPTLCGQTY